MKDKLIDGKKIVSKFRGKLVKMIKDAGSKFGDYSISSKMSEKKLKFDNIRVNKLTKKNSINLNNQSI